MRNYQALFDRGYKYSKNTVEIWDKRRSKLQAMYVHPKYAFQIPKRQKIMRLIGEIDERMSFIIKFIKWAGVQRIQAHLDFLQAVILLECPDRSCRFDPMSPGLAVRLKNYVPGKEKCILCGQELVTQEDRSIDKMLLQMGIPLSE